MDAKLCDVLPFSSQDIPDLLFQKVLGGCKQYTRHVIWARVAPQNSYNNNVKGHRSQISVTHGRIVKVRRCKRHHRAMDTQRANAVRNTAAGRADAGSPLTFSL